jgi:hypothetical protein
LKPASDTTTGGPLEAGKIAFSEHKKRFSTAALPNFFSGWTSM